MKVGKQALALGNSVTFLDERGDALHAVALCYFICIIPIHAFGCIKCAYHSLCAAAELLNTIGIVGCDAAAASANSFRVAVKVAAADKYFAVRAWHCKCVSH